MEQFIKLYDSIVKRQDLTATDKLVYGVISRYQGHKAIAWPSQETIADHIGSNVRTIRRSILHLLDLRLITIHEKGDGRRSTTYEVPALTAINKRKALAFKFGQKRAKEGGHFVLPARTF